MQVQYVLREETPGLSFNLYGDSGVELQPSSVSLLHKVQPTERFSHVFCALPPGSPSELAPLGPPL